MRPGQGASVGLAGRTCRLIRIIGGTHRGRPIKAVPGRITRPTSSLVRKALFDIARDVAGARVLDLFAGTGAIALEALSRGASHAVAIEQAKPAVSTILANARALGLDERLTVVRGDVMRALEERSPFWAAMGPFDLIYADPPYAFADWGELCVRAARFLAPGGLLIIEHPADVGIPPLGNVSPRDYRYGGSVLSVFRG